MASVTMEMNDMPQRTTRALGALVDREPYVDAAAAAKFLGVNRRTVLRWAREGKIPAHPASGCRRKTWRFRLSELDEFMRSR